MRLVTFEHGGAVRTGALLPDDRVLDLPAADASVPASMVRLLASGALDRVRGLVAHAGADAGLPLADVRLLAPVPDPGKVIGIGYNYRGHQVVEDPEYPDVFAKTANTITAPGAPIWRPLASDEVDYEAELAVIIGSPTHEVPEDEALAHVGGYAVFNDVSARDWRRHGSQWVPGKSFDTFGPLGPALVTADEVPDPQDVRTRAGGVVATVEHEREEDAADALDEGDQSSRGWPLEPSDDQQVAHVRERIDALAQQLISRLAAEPPSHCRPDVHRGPQRAVDGGTRHLGWVHVDLVPRLRAPASRAQCHSRMTCVRRSRPSFRSTPARPPRRNAAWTSRSCRRTRPRDMSS